MIKDIMKRIKNIIVVVIIIIIIIIISILYRPPWSFYQSVLFTLFL